MKHQKIIWTWSEQCSECAVQFPLPNIGASGSVVHNHTLDMKPSLPKEKEEPNDQKVYILAWYNKQNLITFRNLCSVPTIYFLNFFMKFLP